MERGPWWYLGAERRFSRNPRCVQIEGLPTRSQPVEQDLRIQIYCVSMLTLDGSIGVKAFQPFLLQLARAKLQRTEAADTKPPSRNASHSRAELITDKQNRLLAFRIATEWFLAFVHKS